MTIAKSRHGVTWNVFMYLVVNSLTFYLKDFLRLEMPPIDWKSKVGFFLAWFDTKKAGAIL